MSKQHVITEETVTDYSSPAKKWLAEKLVQGATFLCTKTVTTVQTKRVVIIEDSE